MGVVFICFAFFPQCAAYTTEILKNKSFSGLNGVKTTVADAVSTLGTPCELNIFHLNKNFLMRIMIVEFEYVRDMPVKV